MIRMGHCMKSIPQTSSSDSNTSGASSTTAVELTSDGPGMDFLISAALVVRFGEWWWQVIPVVLPKDSSLSPYHVKSTPTNGQSQEVSSTET